VNPPDASCLPDTVAKELRRIRRSTWGSLTTFGDATIRMVWRSSAVGPAPLATALRRTSILAILRSRHAPAAGLAPRCSALGRSSHVMGPRVQLWPAFHCSSFNIARMRRESRVNRATCVVTGGAGFIGSELVHQLSARGERVVVIDNLVNGKRGNLAACQPGTVTLVEADIRDIAAVQPHLRDAHTVYHLACLGVRHSVHSPVENHEVNATATLRLLEASRDAGVPKFVYVSSSEVYGTARWAPMNEDHPTSPCTVYGASKLAAESYARAFYKTYGYPTVVVRPFNAYGPRSHHEGDSGEVIPKFLLRCLAGRPMVVFGDGAQTRDFTYVEDSARGILLAGTTETAIGRTVNLGAGSEISINDLAHAVAATVGCSAQIAHDEPRPGDVLRLCADVSQARACLNYDARISLTVGLAHLLDWYRSIGTAPEELLRHDIVRNWQPRGESVQNS
jgi:UDP-glucose 4-epimerase